MAGFGPKMMRRMDVYLPKNPTYSDRLLYLMTAQNLTRKELAEKSGVSETSISNYLYKDRLPKFDIAARIAVALGVSMEWMAGIDKSELDH